jgi:hypothetical protein
MYRILELIPDISSCAHYRNVMPALNCRDELLKHDIELDTTDKFTLEDSGKYDCYIFSRTPPEKMYPVVLSLAARGSKIVWDLDDELWNIPDWNPYKKEYDDIRLAFLGLYLSLSSHLICSTENLRQSALKKFVGIDPTQVVTLENLISVNHYNSFDCPRVDHKKVRIMWSGGNSHIGDFGPVIDLYERYKDRNDVMFIFFGHIPEQIKADDPSKALFVSWNPRKYYEGVISLLQPDIALCPLDDHPFNHCKSAIKYFEMTMAGATVIASKGSTYDNVGCVTCLKNDDWGSMCDILIDDVRYRREVFMEDQHNVINNFSWNYDNPRRRAWINFFKSLPLTPSAIQR